MLRVESTADEQSAVAQESASNEESTGVKKSVPELDDMEALKVLDIANVTYKPTTIKPEYLELTNRSLDHSQ